MSGAIPRFDPSPEQQAVIDHPLQPVRVEAGAGTGKTATLAARIVRLVEAGLVEPEEVLGVTFTNKAAEELSDRIRSELASVVEPGREVEVNTYHGFAARLLEEFGALVGVERDARIVTPTFSRQLLEDALAGGSGYLHLDLTFRPGVVGKLARLASQLGDHLQFPDEALAAAPPDPDEVWSERIELLRTLQRYQQEKQRLRVVDYADLIHRAHLLVSRHPEVAQRVASRFRVVLLDEYQDTNPAQRELLRHLFSASYPVTAVGDPDQTIYEWRGASLQNFAAFPSHFPTRDGPAATLPLSLNRRSGQRILDVANQVRAKIDERARPPLRPLEGALPGRVTVRWERTATEEAESIARSIVDAHDRGSDWRDVAVLVRKNKDIALIHDALEEEGVPVEVASLGGLLGIPEVADVHAWLRILGDPEDGPALLRILLGSRYRLGMADLIPAANWVRAHSGGESDPEHAVPAVGLAEALEHLEELEWLEPRPAEVLAEFRTLYRKLLRDAQGVSLVELVRRILDATGAWQEVEAMAEAHRLSARLNLYRFLDLAEEWSPLEGRPSLQAFLDHLALMQEGQAEELDTARLSGEDAVALLSVHRAKGLEWPVVFLPALTKGTFPSKVVAYDDPYRASASLPYELRIDRSSLPPLAEGMTEKHRTDLLRPRHDSQEWRVAYVAVTRAKEELNLSGAWWYGSPQPSKKPSQRSELFELVASIPGVEVGSMFPEPGDRPDYLRAERRGDGAPDPVFSGGWDEGLRSAINDAAWPRARAEQLGVVEAFDRQLEGFTQLLLDLPDTTPLPPAVEPLRTTVSGLVTYAGCPRRYFWSEVDRLPRRSSLAARRGVEVHRRIEVHNRGAVPLDEVIPGTYDVAPTEDGGGEKTDPFQAFRDSRFATTRPLLVEAPFDLALAGGARVRGRIDAVYEPTPRHWEVVDFKSGRPSHDPARRVQLQAYALAIEETGLALDPPEGLTVTFAYLGDGLVEESEQAGPQWLEEARHRVSELVEGIETGAFEPTPSPACEGCDFLTFCVAGRTFLAQQGT